MCEHGADTAASSVRESTLIDVPLNLDRTRSTVPVLVLIKIVCPILLLWWIAGYFVEDYEWSLTLVAAALASILALIVHRAVTFRHLDRWCRAMAQIAADADLREALLGNRRDLDKVVYYQQVSKLTDAFIDAGRLQTTVRICSAEMADAIEPLSFVFEPRLLDERELRDDELLQASGKPGSERKSAKSSSWWSTICRWNQGVFDFGVRLQRSWLAAVLFIAVLVWIGLLVQPISGMPPVWLTLIIVVIAGEHLISRRGGILSLSRWWLVPGGVIVRRTGWFRRRSDLHLFDRRASALCVFRQQRSEWGVIVADLKSRESLTATRREVDYLLRAWLSPLEPPAKETVEQLL